MSPCPTLLPEWARSARFRLTILYSGLLFLLAAVLVGTLYLGLSLSVRDEPVSRAEARAAIEAAGGDRRAAAALLERRRFEQRVTAHTLENLRNFSLGALGALFAASLGVGWIISGRVLAPIDRMTGVVRDIQATNLSRRIALEGPDDELRRLADTFDEMLARLEEAFAAQRRLVADASHELRNPLAIAQTNLDVALSDPDVDTARVRRAALVARRATDRMARLAEDLLALARLDAPAGERELVDLAELACEASEDFGESARRRGVLLETDASPGIVVLGERDGLKRAAGNLIDNAIRHSPPGGRVRLAAGREDGWATLTVEDEGPGIGPEHHAYLFNRFYRVDKARSRADGGSGLGLAIVRAIAEAHGGRAQVVSEPGRGAAFTLTLPFAGTS